MLLRRSLINPEIVGHRFFWHLRSEMHDPRTRDRFGVLLRAYVTSLCYLLSVTSLCYLSLLPLSLLPLSVRSFYSRCLFVVSVLSVCSQCLFQSLALDKDYIQ